MRISLPKRLLLPLLALLCSLGTSSQDLGGSPVHFDNNFMITDPANASYSGFKERKHNAFITTLYAHPSLKVATLTFADRQLTRRHGALTGYHPDGAPQFSSHYHKNRLHGQWTSWYATGLVCDSGSMNNGLPDGKWITLYPGGQVRTVRTYSARKYHALKEEIRRGGKTHFFALTPLSKENPSLLRQLTTGAYSYAEQGSTLELRTDRALPLKVIADHNTGISHAYYHPPFHDCLHHGLYMNYKEDGAIQDSGYFKNGLRDGVWIEWVARENARAIGFYEHGRKKGTWKYFNTTNKLLYIQHYNRHGNPIDGKAFQ